MKKALLFAFAIFTTSTLLAEISYINYGSNGWHIGLNENVIVDIDEDGSPDFYINGHANELGFVPIFAQGCFGSESSGAYNNIGSRELKIYQAGDILDPSINTFAFIDDDRGSGYEALTGTFADGWTDGEDVYIGFFIFTSGKFGWMKVSIDATAQELIIKEAAFEDAYQAIEIGDTGQPQEQAPNLTYNQSKESNDGVLESTVSTNELEKNIQELTISPNPANEFVNIYLDYNGEEALNIVISNSVGQEVYRTYNNIPNGEINLEIPVTNWNSGVYFVQFQSKKGIKTERISVGK